MNRARSRIALLLVFLFVTAATGYLFGVQPIWSKMNLGLDIQGGIRVVYQAKPPAGEGTVSQDAIQRTLRIMEQRVNALGVSEPLLQQQGSDRIVVELAGVDDPEQAIETIGRTALLEFRGPEDDLIVTGAHLEKADAELHPTTGVPMVTLQFNAEGSRLFADATKKYLHQQISIVLDGEVLQSPSVNDVIETGQATISPYPSYESAFNIAVALQSGALPLELDIVENRTVSATLGQDSWQKTQYAAVIGVVAVIAFMWLLYRIPGFWATVALLLYILLLTMSLYGIGATLTLPGVAGIVLSVGMAVDANIIIFERIRDEFRAGHSLRASVETGFRNAMRAVIDANVTTLIGAGLLLWLGTGPVRGFALTLGLGVILSMLTAVGVTHYLLRWLVSSGMKPGPMLFGKGGDPK